MITFEWLTFISGALLWPIWRISWFPWEHWMGKTQNSKNRQIVSFFPTFYKSCSWDRSSNDFSTIWDPRSRTNRVLILLFLNRSQRGGNLFSRGNFWLQIKSVGTNQRPSLTKECLRRKRGGGIFNIHTRLFLQFLQIIFGNGISLLKNSQLRKNMCF